MKQHNFADLGLTWQDVEALERLEVIKRGSEEHLSKVFELPEFGLLELASRASSELRQFKHIQQMCVIHATHFEMSNSIKTLYLLDSYLSAAAELNPLGVCSAARSLLELHAVLRYVEHLLIHSCAGEEQEWRDRGQRYFNVILQARFGTNDATAQQVFKSEGFPETALRPVRIKDARAFLAHELTWIAEHCIRLCDFVHPFMWGQQTVRSLAEDSHVARNPAGGAFVMSKKHFIVQYKFPMLEAGQRAVHETATRALENTRGIVKTITNFPRSPFTRAEVTAKTGFAMGFRSLSRNSRCLCGSGKKYKNCHGAAVFPL
jgi:hypothetical protein